MITQQTLANSLASGSGGIMSPTPVYATPTTTTVPLDWTGIIPVGTKIILDDAGTKKYGYIAKTSYNSVNTIFTLSPLGTSTGAATTNLSGGTINNVWVGNTGGLLLHPKYIAYSPTVSTGTSANITFGAKFACDGKSLELHWDTVARGTWNNANVIVTIPSNFTIDTDIRAVASCIISESTLFYPAFVNQESSTTLRWRRMASGAALVNPANATTAAIYGQMFLQIE